MNKGDFSKVNFENAQLTKADAGHDGSRACLIPQAVVPSMHVSSGTRALHVTGRGSRSQLRGCQFQKFSGGQHLPML